MESKIQHLKNDQINKEAWDRCIISDLSGQPYALSWYLDIVSPNWEAFVIQGNQFDYELVLPLPVKKQFGIYYLKQPYFCQQLGVFGIKLIDKVIFDSFLKKIKDNFSYVIDYTFHAETNENHENLSNSGMTQYLNLNKSYEITYSGYSRDRKLNLSRAKKSGLKIFESDDIEPLIKMFKINTANKIYGGVSEEAYTILRSLFEEFRNRKMVKLFYTQDERKDFLTSGMFLVWKNRIIYLFNSSTPEGKKRNGNTLILDHVIKTYSDQGYILDFESPSEEFTEITGFYKSFGSNKVLLKELKYNHLPTLIKMMKNIRGSLILSMKS